MDLPQTTAETQSPERNEDKVFHFRSHQKGENMATLRLNSENQPSQDTDDGCSRNDSLGLSIWAVAKTTREIWKS